MDKERKTKVRGIVFAVACISSLILICSSIVMMISYSNELEYDAGIIAQQGATIASARLKEAIDSYESNAKAAAVAVANGYYEDEDDFKLKFQRIVDDVLSGEVMFVRYFDGDQEYYSNGEPFDSSIESRKVLEFIKERRPICAGVIDDREFSISTIAVCVPIENFQYADAMVVFYPTSSFARFSDDVAEADYESARFVGICSAVGETITILRSEDFEISQHNNIYEVLRSLINDKSVIDSMQAAVNSCVSDHFSATIGDKKCVISVSSIEEYDLPTFFVVGVYDNDALISSGYTTVRILLGIFFVLFVLLVLISVYMIIKNRRDLKSALSTGETDDQLGCPNRVKFERTATELMNRYKTSDFAVVVCDINHYEYLNEQNGHEAMLTVLEHLKILYSRLLQPNETYGYLNSGRFALFLHFKDIDTLAGRLKSVSSLAASHGSHLAGSFQLELLGGIYLTNKDLTPQVSKMIDLATDAEKTSNFPYDFASFRIYNELIHQSSVQNDYIELHMESALEHHDFKVFYQPKYHVLNNKADSCEALVRWYNPEIDDYMQPGVFIPLFEANRFIVKLDHYVYEQVCIYVEDAMEHNLPLVPVSVNVSRITASDSDFVSYYTAVKEQHGIPDGFLGIEFTESFAFEDYDMLRDIIGTLHKNGFKCAIDDFGSGFSSYNILKELPMDEIKLDRFFIREGYSRDRDLKILKSIIELGRALNMKVTQEGVETLDQLALLRSMGCHVIQGYHYSKPLSLSAYLEFLENKGKSSR